MFRFNKLCKKCEKLNPVQRNTLIVEKSTKILNVFRKMSTTSEISATNALAAFIVGSAISDGIILEKEYKVMYPALVKAFGSDYDFEAIKMAFLDDVSGIIQLKEYTANLTKIIRTADIRLEYDVLTLCVLIVSANGKVTRRERRYLKQLRFHCMKLM